MRIKNSFPPAKGLLLLHYRLFQVQPVTDFLTGAVPKVFGHLNPKGKKKSSFGLVL